MDTSWSGFGSRVLTEEERARIPLDILGEHEPKRDSKTCRDPSQAKLWRSYREQVKEGKKHPTTTVFGHYFLAPERLSNNEREDVGAHIRECPRCQEIQSRYETYREHFRLQKDCD